MYPSITTDNQKSVAHPPYGHPAAGIPVTSGSQFYVGGNQQHHHHTPPMNQQHHHHVPPMNYSGDPPKPLGSWSTGLCDCCDDVPNCCMTCWCPCITFGRIAEVVDKGATSCGMSGALYALIAIVIGCPCFYSCFYRSKLRQQYMLHETPCGDCLVHCCCESCALCQEYRELKHHGFDMKIGWQGNAERQNREVAMAPVVEEGMTR